MMSLVEIIADCFMLASYVIARVCTLSCVSSLEAPFVTTERYTDRQYRDCVYYICAL